MGELFASDLLVGLAAAAYAAATVAYFAHLSRRGGSARAVRYARALMWSGIALHTAFLVSFAYAIGVCPAKTIHTGLSLGAVVAAAAYLTARKRLTMDGLGVVVAPIALLFLLAGRFMSVSAVSPAMRNRLLPLHISSNVLGDAFFLLASGAAVMYLLQDYELKSKHLAAVQGRLPPLDTLDRMAYRFLQIGFPFMTIGVMTGTLWISKLTGGTPAEILRVMFGYLAWIAFSIVLLLRTVFGWRGRRAAYGTLTGFALCVLVAALYFSRAGMEPR